MNESELQYERRLCAEVADLQAKLQEQASKVEGLVEAAEAALHESKSRGFLTLTVKRHLRAALRTFQSGERVE